MENFWPFCQNVLLMTVSIYGELTRASGGHFE